MPGIDPQKETLFHELYQQNVDAVFRICYSFLKNRADTEDAVQETFLRLMQSEKVLTGDASYIHGWLVVTASNICKNMLRSWIFKKRQEVEDWEELMTESPFSSHDEQSELSAALLHLPDKYKTALYLYYYEGYSCQEIASIMEKKEATIRSLLKRGRNLLQERLGGEADGHKRLEGCMGQVESNR